MIGLATCTLLIAVPAWGLGYWIHRRAESMTTRP